VTWRLAELQRKVRAQFTAGSYQDALELSKDLKRQIAEHLGHDHPAVASACSDIALSNKMLGEYESAIESYLESIAIYRTKAGELHPQSIDVMSNLGLCFQAAALSSGGLEKATLMDRAVETLEETVRLRKLVCDPEHRRVVRNTRSETFAAVTEAEMHLATAKVHATIPSRSRQVKQDDLVMQATEAVRCYLEELQVKYQGKDNRKTALALNNLGFVLKTAGHFDEAKVCYEDALRQRESLLGVSHPDTIVTKSNLAELCMAAGDDETAARLQKEILAAFGVSEGADGRVR